MIRMKKIIHIWNTLENYETNDYTINLYCNILDINIKNIKNGTCYKFESRKLVRKLLQHINICNVFYEYIKNKKSKLEFLINYSD